MDMKKIKKVQSASYCCESANEIDIKNLLAPKKKSN